MAAFLVATNRPAVSVAPVAISHLVVAAVVAAVVGVEVVAALVVATSRVGADSQPVEEASPEAAVDAAAAAEEAEAGTDAAAADSRMRTLSGIAPGVPITAFRLRFSTQRKIQFSMRGPSPLMVKNKQKVPTATTASA